MQADGIIVVTEPKKGVEMISSINQTHEKLEHFRVIKYQEPEPSQNSQSKKANNAYEPPSKNDINNIYVISRYIDRVRLNHQTLKTL